MAIIRFAGKTEGLNKFRATLQQLPEEATRGVTRALEQAAINIAARAVQLVPVRTGTLRDSIAWELDKDRLGVRIGVRPPAHHAVMVEFGTQAREGHPGTPAQPFMLPAYRQNKNPAKDMIRRQVNKALRSKARA